MKSHYILVVATKYETIKYYKNKALIKRAKSFDRCFFVFVFDKIKKVTIKINCRSPPF